MNRTQSRPLVQVKNLSKVFQIKQSFLDAVQRKPKQYLKAVDDVSFDILEGETLGLVGESGCGKSTLARTVIRLYDPDGGSIEYGGENIAAMKSGQLRERRKQFQMIFQDPYSSLNPRMTVRETLAEVLGVHKLCSREDTEKRILELLDMVGINRNSIDRFPGEFSGGQRQRVGIARALAVNPSFLLADEPVSALDVSIQAQIINLLSDLQKDLGLTLLFISHDLRVVRLVTHRVAVMYLGKIVELADTESLYREPMHPYSKILMLAAPVLDPTNRTRDYVIEGEPPSPVHLPTGCRFHPRCPYATEQCRAESPQLTSRDGRWVACHHPLV